MVGARTDEGQAGSAGTERRSRSRYPGSGEKHYGAILGLERLVTTHLFVVCPNNSGSTFLKNVLATSRATWNLKREGQWMLGYRGPILRTAAMPGPPLLWASTQASIDRVTDASAYDWTRNRRAWYFQAFARAPDASVFVTKTPAHLLVVDELARHFDNPRFLFMVRNPYAVCEGICRRKVLRGMPDLPVAENAARHVVACLDRQRRNVEVHRDRGVFFTYEEMCAEPERVARRIRRLVPELDDLNLRQRVPVKGDYDEMPTDMNARQIARLEPRRIAALNRVFRPRRALLRHFGYEVIEEG